MSLLPRPQAISMADFWFFITVMCMRNRSFCVTMHVECNNNHLWGPLGARDMTNFEKNVFSTNDAFCKQCRQCIRCIQCIQCIQRIQRIHCIQCIQCAQRISYYHNIIITWIKIQPFCTLQTPFDIMSNALFNHGYHPI